MSLKNYLEQVNEGFKSGSKTKIDPDLLSLKNDIDAAIKKVFDKHGVKNRFTEWENSSGRGGPASQHYGTVNEDEKYNGVKVEVAIVK